MEMILDIVVRWFVPFALGGIIAFLKSKLDEALKQNKQKEDRSVIIENAVQSLLRDRLIDKYRHYKSVGEMTILDKENIDHLYNEYLNLGGNGTVKELFDDLKDVDIKIIKE